MLPPRAAGVAVLSRQRTCTVRGCDEPRDRYSTHNMCEEHDRREIAETIDRLRRYLDDIDISKESAVVLQDELRARSLASSEHATYMLTIVAGIFLPLGFLTGLLGINVGGMPGMEDPDAFWLVVGLCLVLFVALIVTFRRLRWL